MAKDHKCATCSSHRQGDADHENHTEERAFCVNHADRGDQIKTLFESVNKKVSYVIFFVALTFTVGAIGTLFQMQYAARADVATKSDIQILRVEQTTNATNTEERLAQQISELRSYIGSRK